MLTRPHSSGRFSGFPKPPSALVTLSAEQLACSRRIILAEIIVSSMQKALPSAFAIDVALLATARLNPRVAKIIMSLGGEKKHGTFRLAATP